MDLQEDLAYHNKDVRKQVSIFQGNYAAAEQSQVSQSDRPTKFHMSFEGNLRY